TPRPTAVTSPPSLHDALPICAPIENATFIVSGNRFTQVGRAGNARVPAGAARVNLAGKTVMPTIIDTHNHLSQTRPMLIDDLKRSEEHTSELQSRVDLVCRLL